LTHPVPLIDQLAGIKHYCTAFSGIGGRIKRDPVEFLVKEILNESYLKNLSKNSNATYRFPVYILKKRNIDSNHAVIEIKDQLNLELRVIGIKDAKASTTQYATTTKKIRYIHSKANTHHTNIFLVGYGRTPLSKSDLWGNEFSIMIVEPKRTDLTEFLTEIDKVANFYGLQRFGSERMVTHLVGKEILGGNFRRASELILTHTTRYDTAYSMELRERLADPNNYTKLINELPKGMDIERKLVQALIKRKDYVYALRAIPIGIRRLYVQAYQSYIFNLCISNCLSYGEDITKGKDGDLCFEIESGDVLGRIRRLNPSIDNDSTTLPAIQLAGYSFQTRRGRFEFATHKILKEEGVAPKEFYVKDMQELSTQGGFRQSVLWCKGFSHSGSLLINFKLPKGSYATTLLREIMKPDCPIEVGF
jgi:tRNA pseudouridine13 synthase